MLYLGENNYDVYLGDSFATIYCGEEIVYPTTITGISITKKAEINPTGGEKLITIRSESAWTLSKDSSATWVTLSADSGDSGVSKVTVSVAPLSGNTDLTTIITAQTTDLQYSATCQVIQHPYPIPQASEFLYYTNNDSAVTPFGVGVSTSTYTDYGRMTFTSPTVFVSEIPRQMFSAVHSPTCNNLTKVYLYSGITTIGKWAFEACSNLLEIYSFNPTAPSLAVNVFLNMSSGGTLHIPSGSDYSSWTNNLNNWTVVDDL